jgi:hypothetical protein
MIDDLSTIDETASNNEIQETYSAISDGEQQEDEVSVVVDDTERSADDNFININNEDSEGGDSDDEDSDDDQDYGAINVMKTASSHQIIDEQSSNHIDVAITPIESKTSNSVPFEASTESGTSNFSIDDADKESEEILVTPRNVAVDIDSRRDSSEITCSVVTWNLAELSPTGKKYRCRQHRLLKISLSFQESAVRQGTRELINNDSIIQYHNDT